MKSCANIDKQKAAIVSIQIKTVCMSNLYAFNKCISKQCVLCEIKQHVCCVCQ